MLASSCITTHAAIVEVWSGVGEYTVCGRSSVNNIGQNPSETPCTSHYCVSTDERTEFIIQKVNFWFEQADGTTPAPGMFLLADLSWRAEGYSYVAASAYCEGVVAGDCTIASDQSSSVNSAYVSLHQDNVVIASGQKYATGAVGASVNTGGPDSLIWVYKGPTPSAPNYLRLNGRLPEAES